MCNFFTSVGSNHAKAPPETDLIHPTRLSFRIPTHIMKTKLMLLILAFTGASLLNADDTKPGKGGPGGPGGNGNIHILPRGAREKLNLTQEQQKQIGDLEADVKKKLESILTAQQIEQLKQMRPQGPGGPGGQGGPGAQGGGGKGGKQRPQGDNS